MQVYIIVPTEEVTQAMLDVCLQNSLATVRKSLDGALSVLKFDDAGGTPVELTGYTPHTHVEILAKLATPVWTDLGAGH